VASLIDDQEVTVYDQLNYYTALTQIRSADRSAGRSVTVTGRELSRSRRARRPRRRAR
jgi:hypothetical protein